MKKILLALTLILLTATGLSAQQTNRQKLAGFVDAMNEECPIILDADLTLNKFALNDQYFIFDCTNDESEVSMESASMLKDELKEAFGEMLAYMASEDEGIAVILYGVSSEGLGVQFRLHGEKSKQTLDINFTPEEIEEMLFGDFMFNDVEPIDFDALEF